MPHELQAGTIQVGSSQHSTLENGLTMLYHLLCSTDRVCREVRDNAPVNRETCNEGNQVVIVYFFCFVFIFVLFLMSSGG